jgi:hypothetical protein
MNNYNATIKLSTSNAVEEESRVCDYANRRCRRQSLNYVILSPIMILLLTLLLFIGISELNFWYKI